MLDRAVVQPDPVVFLGTAADIMEAAAAATSPDHLFFLLEDAGVMLRIDRSVTPTMAKVPTLAQWELDRLRTIDRVVRLGHIRHVEPGRLVLTDGEVAIAPDAVVVHCAASGLQYPPLVPIWGREAITLQPIRTHLRLLRCRAGRLRRGDARGRRREEPPVPTRAVLQHTGRLGASAGARRSGVSFTSHPHIRDWADTVSLNPARIPPELAGSAAVTAAQERFEPAGGPGDGQDGRARRDVRRVALSARCGSVLGPVAILQRPDVLRTRDRSPVRTW